MANRSTLMASRSSLVASRSRLVAKRSIFFLSVCSQLFWERRLRGLHSLDVSEEVLRSMELPKGLQGELCWCCWSPQKLAAAALTWFPPPAGVGPDISNDTLLSSIASALHTASAPITGQTSVAAEKNPALWLNTAQPLCKAFTVTDEHIR